MISSLPDFVEEETLLQYHARKIGVYVDCTPKCHPELAGEGIEYCWGCSKQHYWNMPLNKKRGKDQFRKSVRDALSRDMVLTIGRVRAFARRAREYILAYHSLNITSALDPVSSPPVLSSNIIEKVVKSFKTHRSASDFDQGFIGNVVRTMNGISNCQKNE